MKLAFVYDWFDKTGGAERILTVLHEMYPDAPWYTSYRDVQNTPWSKGWDVRVSFLQSFPQKIRSNRLITLPLMPLAFESFDFATYDVVVSITSCFAKYIITRPSTKHICYLLTPTRWLWIDDYGKNDWVTARIRSVLRLTDRSAASRVDEFVSISKEVNRRCSSIYQRPSDVIYPPFEYEKWANQFDTVSCDDEHPYSLVVSRLEPYKRIDLVIDAWSRQKEQLIIVGTGSQEEVLKKRARGKNIKFQSRLSDEELQKLYMCAQCLIMPQKEDYGYIALEAQACGCPVVAYGHGGARETVTFGVFFAEQTEDALCDALEKCRKLQYNPDTYENSHIRGRSRNTFVAAFSQKITKAV